MRCYAQLLLVSFLSSSPFSCIFSPSHLILLVFFKPKKAKVNQESIQGHRGHSFPDKVTSNMELTLTWLTVIVHWNSSVLYYGHAIKYKIAPSILLFFLFGTDGSKKVSALITYHENWETFWSKWNNSSMTGKQFPGVLGPCWLTLLSTCSMFYI